MRQFLRLLEAKGKSSRTCAPERVVVYIDSAVRGIAAILSTQKISKVNANQTFKHFAITF